MSGLEGIAALGLACNILQLIGAVGSTIKVAKNILESGTIDPELEKRTNELTALFRDAEGSMSQTSQHKDDQELRVAAGRVLKATSEFKSELAKISGGASKGKIRQVIGGTFKGVWRRQKLDKLEAEVSRCRGMFESRLLLSLRHRVDLGALQREESFCRLDNSLQGFIKGLSDGHTRLEELINYQSTTLMAHVTEESRQTRQEISTAMNTVVLKMSQEEKQRFVESLRYDTMNERRNRVEVAHPGTFKWIFYDSDSPYEDEEDDEQYDEEDDASHKDGDEDDDARYVPEDRIPDFIKSGSEKLYWISGKPGSGKSTLMKFMLENSRMKDLLNQISPTGTSTIASHFIWAAGAPIQRSLRGTLSSLLFQLITQDEGALEYLLSNCPRGPRRLSLSDWSDRQLAEALKIVCSCSQSIICLFIDGLDEIDPEHTDNIIAVISDLCTSTSIKCIVSSRPEHIFSRHFRKLKAPFLRMQDLTEHDIRRYVREKLRSWSHDPEIYHDVVDTLCKQADGVFLWVALALRGQRLSADYEDDPEIVARRFKQLPSGLSELYSNMWNRLNEDKAIYGEQGAKYLNTYLIDAYEDGNDPQWLASNWNADETSDLLRMAFATDPALTLEFFNTSNPSILEHVESRLDKVAVWLEVRTAGLIEVNHSTEQLNLVHRSALEFLQSDSEGLKIRELDRRTEEERRLSYFMADLAALKYRCDIDRLGQFVSLRPRRLLYDLCGLTLQLNKQLRRIMRSYRSGQITKVGYFKVLDQAASTYHAIRFMANKHPFRQCGIFTRSISGDYLGIMAKTGAIEYVSAKVEEYLTENKPSWQYLEYLWAEACFGSPGQAVERGLDVLGEIGQVELGPWLLSLLPHHNTPSLASILGGYHRTATGLVCTRPLRSVIHFQDIELSALRMTNFQPVLQDASPKHRVLLQFSWPARWLQIARDHIFGHSEQFDIFIELPLKATLQISNARKRYHAWSDGLDRSNFLESFVSEMAESRPGLIFIQSLDLTSQSPELFSVYPEQYFSLKTEADERVVTTAVIRNSVQAAVGSVLEGDALCDFVINKLADNGFNRISTRQFEDVLIERGHAFRPSEERPWPPAIFEGMTGPSVQERPGTGDYLAAPATSNVISAQVYDLQIGVEPCKVVIEGDVLRVVRRGVI